MIAVLLIALGLRLLFLWTGGLANGQAFFSDDALITLRYAQNLAAGHGFVYNPGEFVLGTTTPLYTLLMTIPALFRVDLMVSAIFFNILFDGLSTVLFWKALEKGGFPRTSRLWLTLAFASNPVLLRWSVYGMETSLLVFLAFLTAWWFWNGKYFLAGITGSLILLTRPDGGLFLIALFLTHSFFSISTPAFFRPWKWVLGLALPLVTWLSFSHAYFHALLPQSILSKKIIYGMTPPSLSAVLNLGRGFWLLPAALLGMFLLMRSIPERKHTLPAFFSRWAVTFMIWALLLVAFFALARAPAHLYEWYRVPLFAALSVLVAAAFPPLPTPLTQPRIIATLCLVPLVLFLASPFAGMLIRGPKQQSEKSTFMHLSVGRWLRENTAPNATVMAGNIGYIGFYSGRRILDNVGLVSPEVLPLLIEYRGKASPLIEAFKPDYLALEARESQGMAAEIQRHDCRLVYSVSLARPSAQSPYRVYHCLWN